MMEGDAIRRWFAAALAAVAPATAVARHLRRAADGLAVDGTAVPVPGRLIVVGAGKAAVEMARGVETVCGDLVAAGFVITKDGHAGGPPLRRIRIAEAAHPIPDERGVRATHEVLALVRQTRAGDVVLALISGGGSALLTAPRPPVTLTDLAVTTDLLLRAGAPIEALNAVRTPLSLVKGGGLRQASPQAAFVTLILSDVLGNDPAVIASGPTIPFARDPAAALDVLARYGLTERVPASVLSGLETGALTPPIPLSRCAGEGGLFVVPSPSIGRRSSLRWREVGRAAPPSGGGRSGGRQSPRSGGVRAPSLVAIVGDNAAAVEAAAAAARRDGFRPRIVWARREGEARDLGQDWVAWCGAAGAGDEVLLGGGEATVTVTGDGIGGRNTEFALAAALALAAQDRPAWTVASLATDGQDGPTGVAGAIADAGTIERARAAGVDPVAALAANDSLRVFQAADGLVETGPTGTNVNDLYFAVRERGQH